jgi:hypothetical protein
MREHLMGSTGNHNFGDYAQGGGSTTKCDLEIEAALEDVARSEFMQSRNEVPKVGSAITLRSEPVDGRLMVEDAATKLAIGNLPTKYHYLLICMQRGYEYSGEVTAARKGSIPQVEVSLAPS